METRDRVGLAGLVVLLLLIGCTKAYHGYPGPPRAESEIAVITPDEGVRIHALDAKVVNVRPGAARGLYVAHTRLHVRAGRYTLTLIPRGITTIKTFTRLTVEVEAGKRYRVRSQFYPGANDAVGSYKLWVENETTGAVISDIVERRNPFQPNK